MLRDAAGHDAFLLDALAAGGRRYTIVSPWVIAATMERAGFLGIFEAAVRCGANTDIFADSANLISTTRGLLGQQPLRICSQALVITIPHDLRQ